MENGSFVGSCGEELAIILIARAKWIKCAASLCVIPMRWDLFEKVALQIVPWG